MLISKLFCQKRFCSYLVCYLPVISIFISIHAGDVLAQNVSVQLLNAKLRSAPKHFSSSTLDLKFGDTLKVISKSNGWLNVTTPNGQSGYVHESAITTKQIVLTSKQVTLADVAVDESQVYLAGKGFNAGVEKSFSTQESDTNYTAIDQMSKTLQVSPEQSAKFIKDGKLTELEL
jgi:hypothetical protein